MFLIIQVIFILEKDDGETFEWEMKSQTEILFDSSIEHSVPKTKAKKIEFPLPSIYFLCQ